MDKTKSGIELGPDMKEWEDRRGGKTHIRSQREYGLNGLNSDEHHFIRGLMTSGSG